MKSFGQLFAAASASILLVLSTITNGDTLGDPSPATQPSSANVTQLIVRLGSESIKERDTAQQQLIDIGATAEAELKKAANDADDPEIRSRAGAILATLKDHEAIQPSLITLHAQAMPHSRHLMRLVPSRIRICSPSAWPFHHPPGRRNTDDECRPKAVLGSDA